jgi:hypothetical protein
MGEGIGLEAGRCGGGCAGSIDSGQQLESVVHIDRQQRARQRGDLSQGDQPEPQVGLRGGDPRQPWRDLSRPGPARLPYAHGAPHAVVTLVRQAAGQAHDRLPPVARTGGHHLGRRLAHPRVLVLKQPFHRGHAASTARFASR